MTEIYFAKTAGENYPEMSSAAHNLLKARLAEKLGIQNGEIIIEKDERGKPFVKGREEVFVSLSHSHGVAMCAFSDAHIGVDVELVSKRRKSVENRVFTNSEIRLIDNAEDENIAFFTLWALKESYLKAIGTGFADNAKEIEFSSLEKPIKSNQSEFKFSIGLRDEFVYAICEKQI